MKAVSVGGIIAIVIIIIVTVGFSMPVSDTETRKTNEWISSGPFSIDKQEYLLGENIFLQVDNIQMHEKGEIQFIRASGDIYRTIPFDGSKSSEFNQYFTPFPSRSLKVCSSDDLVGTWTVKFQGTNYKPITFEMKNEYLEGEEWKFVNDCG